MKRFIKKSAKIFLAGLLIAISFIWPIVNVNATGTYDFRVLVIAGGGSGGSVGFSDQRGGGGGGAGGYQEDTSLTLNDGTSITITVGSGGVAPSANGSANGNDSAIVGALSSTGGGGGGNVASGGGEDGDNGGSGGGGSSSGLNGTGTAGQGNDGGDGINNGSGERAGGGGGGASSAGSNASGTVTGGNGGNGTASDITGSSVTRGGGGGGGVDTSDEVPGSGGTGGGGAGGDGVEGTNGTDNTGGGGGGGGSTFGGNREGGNGGSGVVIIRFAGTSATEDVDPNATASEAGGSCDTTNAHSTLDEDPDTPGSDVCSADSATANHDIRLNFATPANSPGTGTNVQTFKINARNSQTSGTGVATVAMDLYCNGVLVEAGADQNLGDTYTTLSETFTFSAVSCNSTGSDVEVLIDCTAANNGGTANDTSCNYDAVEWVSSYNSYDITVTDSTGATESSAGADKVLTWNSSGTFQFTCNANCGGAGGGGTPPEFDDFIMIMSFKHEELVRIAG